MPSSYCLPAIRQGLLGHRRLSMSAEFEAVLGALGYTSIGSVG